MLGSGSVVVVPYDRASIVDAQRLSRRRSGKIDCLESRGSSDIAVGDASAVAIEADNLSRAIYIDSIGADGARKPDRSEYALAEEEAGVVTASIRTRTNRSPLVVDTSNARTDLAWQIDGSYVCARPDESVHHAGDVDVAAHDVTGVVNVKAVS